MENSVQECQLSGSCTVCSHLKAQRNLRRGLDVLMTVNNRGSRLSTCLFNNDVADAKPYSSEKRWYVSTKAP